jgi:hypothetical protein
MRLVLALALACAASDGRAQPPEVPLPAPAAEAAAPPASPVERLTVSLANGTGTLKLFGQFSVLGQAATSRPFPTGGTLFLLPRSAVGNDTNTFDVHGRQTGLGAQFTGPEVLGFTPGAYFLGFIQNDNLASDAYGFLPFNAYGELKNENWRIAGGLMRDVFNPATPTLISLLNLYASGNTGSFAGQVRAERFYKPTDGFELTVQVALRDPVASVVSSNRLVEDNGWPNVEARVGTGWGAVSARAGGRKQRPFEIGVSGVGGQLRNSLLLLDALVREPNLRSIIDVWGFGADVQAALGERAGLVAEVYVGQGLGEYNGGIAQSFNSTTLRAIRSAGGFGEVYYYFTDKLHLHAGYGIDAPLARDLAAAQIVRNQTYFATLVWDVSRNFQVSAEADYRRTAHGTLRDADAVLLIGQLLWRF